MIAPMSESNHAGVCDKGEDKLTLAGMSIDAHINTATVIETIAEAL